MCHCTHLQGKSWQIGKSDMEIKMQNTESAPVKGKKAKDKGYLMIKPLSSHSLFLTLFKTAVAVAAAECSQWWGRFRCYPACVLMPLWLSEYWAKCPLNVCKVFLLLLQASNSLSEPTAAQRKSYNYKKCCHFPLQAKRSCKDIVCL